MGRCCSIADAKVEEFGLTPEVKSFGATKEPPTQTPSSEIRSPELGEQYQRQIHRLRHQVAINETTLRIQEVRDGTWEVDRRICFCTKSGSCLTPSISTDAWDAKVGSFILPSRIFSDELALWLL
jgi:hypothetical protein